MIDTNLRMESLVQYFIYPNTNKKLGEKVTEPLDPEKVMFPFLKKGGPEDYAAWLIGSVKKGKNVNEFLNEDLKHVYIAQNGATILPLFGIQTRKIKKIIVPDNVNVKYLANTQSSADGFCSHFGLYFMNGFKQASNCGIRPLYQNVLPMLKGEIYDEYYQVLSKKMQEKAMR